MLFESVHYHDNLPFEISFLNVGEENKHCHKELEILLVLRGVTHYKIYHMDYELNPGDLIIADVQDLHQIHDSSEDILVVSVHVDTKRFEKTYPNISYMFFVCEACMEGPSSNRQILQSKLSMLKNRIAKLALDSIGQTRDSAQLNEGINDLVSILVNYFQGFFMEDYQYKTGQENLNSVDRHRLSGITRYILLNYNQKITLDDVAKMEHLSSYYVSHLIKKTLGFNFQNFVNAIRLEFAEKFLVFTNLTLMQISENCGFSSPNYFNKCFSAWHGKTPAQYRREYHPCERTFKDAFSQKEAMALLTPYLNFSGVSENNSNLVSKGISICLEGDSGEYDDFWSCYAPRISLSSMEDVMRLGYYDGKIKELKPEAFLLEDALRYEDNGLNNSIRALLEQFHVPVISSSEVGNERPSTFVAAENSALAFKHIFSSKKGRGLPLFGGSNGLFTKEGLATPLYWSYRLFSKLEEPKVKIQEHYALIQSKSGICLVLFNVSPHAVLQYSVSTESLPEKFVQIRTEISERDNCFGIVSDLESFLQIPHLVRDRINENGVGKTDYAVINKKENPKLDFLIYCNTVSIIEVAAL